MTFPRGTGPLISILFPTRNRPAELRESIEAIFRNTADPSRLEFLFKTDEDDTVSEDAIIDAMRAELTGWRCRWMNWRTPRGNGYADMHNWINKLSADASGDWLVIWNDDVTLLTPGWDEILLNCHMDKRFWHGVDDVCALTIATKDQPGATGFFFLRRKVTEILGHFSLIPHNDTWVTTVMAMVGSLFPIPVIEIEHANDKILDAVRAESEPARQTTEYTVRSKINKLKLLDACKLQDYIDANQVEIMDKQLSDVAAKHKFTDADTLALLKHLAVKPGDAVLEVGAHDEPIANILAEFGCKVTGIDLREYNPHQDTGKKCNEEPNYDYNRGDYCDTLFPREYFDAIISISAIEHFGLGTYNEGKPNLCYDIIAMRKMWEQLKPGGCAYITVPFARQFQVNGTHWRTYDQAAIMERLVQDFEVEIFEVFVAGDCIISGRIAKPGDPITADEARTFSGNPPHVSAFLKLKKTPVKRIAPDGR